MVHTALVGLDAFREDEEVDPQGEKVSLDYPSCSQMMADPLAVNNELAIAILANLA